MKNNLTARGALRHQKGATLIVVLIMLLLVTILGVWGIRTAMTSLNIATNSQVGQLLSQTGDTPSNYFLNTSDYNDLTRITTAVGQAITLHKERPGREVIFCYKPTSKEIIDTAFDTTVLVPPQQSANDDTKATIDSVYSNRGGFCDLTKDFGSSREAVVTQVAVKIISEPGAIGADLERGTNQAEGATETKDKVDAKVRVTTTAIMPSFAHSNISDIQNDCIGSAGTVGYINDNLGTELQGKKTVADCLTNYGVPISTQVQEFEMRSRDIQIEAPM
ncbi:hypothetical protein P7L54_01980 [Acinetobacter bereziniae]|uniref:Type 4 fimbrial biogenesis protein PilX N-terminal domain-containing protein n=1 Tax=Acinetobacter bereziniae LMG 1003 = CIP 70.12 TaxID=981324 RepID=N9CVM4_ACIBZ|nr:MULTISPECIES: PilX N-terminal domain-containing pilus assembly protein [Acinetobacter]ENV89631.1 hypothetical protein F938_04568 [Acinetobacter bereziniae LMG 1003 = CIP 70.12]KKW80990.1 hypothetical protein AAV97_03115 [Acinetobacter sp. Ag2]MBJ8551654.1 hypothetical protein [Acinetobacter bereziniae]MBJ9905615.1 hypothetical protein [Acinetobacter bereziniae]MBJ9927755.1 hypothetical protein [Acinetobacter bereziniae]